MFGKRTKSVMNPYNLHALDVCRVFLLTMTSNKEVKLLSQKVH